MKRKSILHSPINILILTILSLAMLTGAHYLKRYVDHLNSRIELMPQQQEVSGHVHKKIHIKGETFYLYQPGSYVVEPVNLKLTRPRMMSFHGDILFIGSQRGAVYRLYPPYTRATPIAEIKFYPHSVVVRDDEIFIARNTGVFKAPYSEAKDWWLEEEDLEAIIEYPLTRSHNSRTLKVGPDNRLYLSMGMPRNCTNYYADPSYPKNRQRGGVFLIDESDKGNAKLVPFASGLRNPVGFDWHPETKTMYASNNGPDHLGYDQPPEYFAKIDQGSFHGMPWFQFNGKHLVRDSCIKIDPPRPMQDVSIPVATFPAHNAPLDVLFVDETANASEFYGDAIVALHGSWVTEDGDESGDPATLRHPKLVRVKFKDGEAVEVIDLVSGFQLEDGTRWAKPAGLAIGPDGDIYFTSDKQTQGLFRLRKIIEDE